MLPGVSPEGTMWEIKSRSGSQDAGDMGQRQSFDLLQTYFDVVAFIAVVL